MEGPSRPNAKPQKLVKNPPVNLFINTRHHFASILPASSPSN